MVDVHKADPALHEVLAIRLASNDFELIQISSRRGVTAFRAVSAANAAMVKVAASTDDGSLANVDSVRHEFEVLRSIPYLATQFSPELVDNGSAALIEVWFEGSPAFKHAAGWMADHDEASLIQLATGAFTELAKLHLEGWVHGDLQPMHYLRLSDGSLVLIDYGVAHLTTHPRPDYRGGMVHFNSPEVCQALAAGRTPTLTPSGDVFSLASVFAFALTNVIYGDYDLSESWETACSAIAAGKFRSEGLRAALGSMPGLERVLMNCLESDPGSRPVDAMAVLAMLPQ